VTVKQLSIFLENRAGRLAAVARLLAQHSINIVALSLADTSEFGILRLIVNHPDEAAALLRQANFTARETEVLAVGVEDRPGGLARVLDALERQGVNVEYMYAFAGPCIGTAALVFRFEKPDQAITVLTDAGINILPAASVLGSSSNRT